MTIGKNKIFKRSAWIAALIALAIIFPLFLWRHFTYIEPPFVILGDNDVLNKLHINVRLYRWDAERWNEFRTVFLNETPYAVDNQGVDHFRLFISYDKKLFRYYSYDNVPRITKDENMAKVANTLLFCKVGSDIFMIPYHRKCDEITTKDIAESQSLMPFEAVLKAEQSGLINSSSIKTKEDEEGFARSFFDVNIH